VRDQVSHPYKKLGELLYFNLYIPRQQAGRQSCLRLLVQYICSHPPYLETLSFNHIMRMHHAMVTRDPLNTV
jgi:hypothetical protein